MLVKIYGGGGGGCQQVTNVLHVWENVDNCGKPLMFLHVKTNLEMV